MAAEGLRVVVVGGSLGGLLVGNLLHRAGCDVTVHERIGTDMSERGAGIATHPELHAAFRRLGLPLDERFAVDVDERVAMDLEGKVLARHRMPQRQGTWLHLYRALRGIFPDTHYAADSNFVRAEPDGARVHAEFDDGTSIAADLLIGADGIRSTVRQQFWPEAVPRYAGYIAWRGVIEEDRLSRETHEALFTRIAFCLPPSEHIVGYPVADASGNTAAGHRRYNVVWYRPTTPEELARLSTDASGHHHEEGIPPELIDPAIIEEMHAAAARGLPPAFAEVMMRPTTPFFQTVSDLTMPQVVKGRVVMLGDAAFAARPHTGMGVTKAAGDALLLTDLIEAFPGALDRALAHYDAERTRFGHYLVHHAQRLGSQIGIAGQAEADRALGAQFRRPETVIRTISMPPWDSPHAALRDVFA